ncbi:hypothetical protein D3C86_1642670 [compost metagenome]
MFSEFTPNGVVIPTTIILDVLFSENDIAPKVTATPPTFIPAFLILVTTCALLVIKSVPQPGKVVALGRLTEV